jgi:hypothetical protein
MMKEDPDDDDEASIQRPIDDPKIQTARTNMALLHFVITAPKWSISLFTFLAARQSPIPSFEYGVQKPLEYLRVAFAMESQAYQECSLNAAVILQNELQLVAQEDYDRINKIHEANEDMVDRAEKQKDQCWGAAKNARDLLLDWQNQGHTVDLVDDPSLCSVTKRDEMEQLLGGEAQLLQDGVTSIWSHHVQESLRGFHLIKDYSKARIRYDYDYFVGLRIRPALDFVSSLPSIGHPTLSIDQGSFQARVSSALDGLRRALLRIEDIIEALNRRIEELSSSIEEFYLAYLAIYNRLLKASKFIADFLPPGVPLPAFFDTTGLPFGEAMLPSFLDLEAFDVDMVAVFSLIDQTVQKCTGIIREIVDELKQQSTVALRVAIDHISDGLLSMLQLDDYNPPKFVGSQANSTSIMDEVEYQEKVARATVNDTKEMLAQLSSIQMPGGSTSQATAVLDGPEETLPKETTTFAYLRPIFPALSLPNVVAVLFSLFSSYTWLFEVGVQAVRLWRLEATYSRGAIPDLPEISYDSTEKETEQPKTAQVFLLMCLRTFLTPRLVIGIIVAPFLLTALSFWYPHVKSNCVESRQGTFLANHFVAPIMMNEAYALGNAYYLKAEIQCYETERALCHQMQAQTIARSVAYQSSLSSMKVDFDASGRSLSVIAGCVHKNTTEAIQDSCCGIKGFSDCEASSTPGYCPLDGFREIPISFRPLREYLVEPSCAREKWPEDGLSETTYDCDKMVEVCEKLPCQGVDNESLRAETVEADCEVELYALDFLAFILLTIFHAVAVNLVCTLLFNGLRSVAWRKLYPDGIRLKTMLRENGRLATGDDQEDRLQRITVAIGRFELAGKLQIASGIILFLVWLFASFC